MRGIYSRYIHISMNFSRQVQGKQLPPLTRVRRSQKRTWLRFRSSSPAPKSEPNGWGWRAEGGEGRRVSGRRCVKNSRRDGSQEGPEAPGGRLATAVGPRGGHQLRGASPLRPLTESRVLPDVENNTVPACLGRCTRRHCNSKMPICIFFYRKAMAITQN